MHFFFHCVEQKELIILLLFVFSKDFHVIICAVYSLLGNVSSPRYDIETTREHTAHVFQKFDKSQQGYVTIQDFMSFCLSVRKLKKNKIICIFLLNSV